MQMCHWTKSLRSKKMLGIMTFRDKIISECMPYGKISRYDKSQFEESLEK